MTQEKIIRFVDLNGNQIGIRRIPCFDCPADEFSYYQQFWADADIAELYTKAHYKLEFVVSNPFFEQMKHLWIKQETDKLCTSLKFSALECMVMPLIMEDKLIKEIADLLSNSAQSTIKTAITRMNEKAKIIENPGAKRLKNFFLTQIMA